MPADQKHVCDLQFCKRHTFGVEEGDPSEGGFGYERISPEFDTYDEAVGWRDRNQENLTRKEKETGVDHPIARYHHAA